MWRYSVILLWMAVMFGVKTEGEVMEKLEDQMLTNDSVKRNDSERSVRQVISRCFQQPSGRCVRLTLARLLKHFPPGGLAVVPGVTLLTNSSASLRALDRLRGLLVAEDPGLRLLPPLGQFLSGLTVKVQLEDPGLLRRVKSLSEEVVDIIAAGDTEGRKKGEGMAMMWAGGALAAAGLAALAAMAGKAMMASMAALMLAAMSAMRGGGGGGGGGGGKHHVEIIKAPPHHAHYELAPMPVHDGAYAFEHDHYYTAASDGNTAREVYYVNGPTPD